MEEFYAPVVKCPLCGGEQEEREAFLGSLGKLDHYRCRYCGGEWHEESRFHLEQTGTNRFALKLHH